MSAPCYCHPTAIGCVHCERAARYVQVEVFTLANELGEAGYVAAIDGVEGAEIQNECTGPDDEIETIDHDIDCDAHSGGDCSYDCYDEYVSDFDSEPKEIYQWFIVSTWLANRLREIDQPVLDYMGLELWGRTCCGQGIALDGTFQNISRRLGV